MFLGGRIYLAGAILHPQQVKLFGKTSGFPQVLISTKVFQSCF